MLTVVNIFFHVTAILFTFPIEANMKQLWFKKNEGPAAQRSGVLWSLDKLLGGQFGLIRVVFFWTNAQLFKQFWSPESLPATAASSWNLWWNVSGWLDANGDRKLTSLSLYCDAFVIHKFLKEIQKSITWQLQYFSSSVENSVLALIWTFHTSGDDVSLGCSLHVKQP